MIDEEVIIARNRLKIDKGTIFTDSVNPNYIGTTMRSATGQLLLASSTNDSVIFDKHYSLVVGGKILVGSTFITGSIIALSSTVNSSAITIQPSSDNLQIRSNDGVTRVNNISYPIPFNTFETLEIRRTATDILIYWELPNVLYATIPCASSVEFSFNKIGFNQRVAVLGFNSGISEARYIFNETGNSPIVSSNPYL